MKKLPLETSKVYDQRNLEWARMVLASPEKFIPGQVDVAKRVMQRLNPEVQPGADAQNGAAR